MYDYFRHIKTFQEHTKGKNCYEIETGKVRIQDG
jgi:hypothetical protein